MIGRAESLSRDAPGSLPRVNALGSDQTGVLPRVNALGSDGGCNIKGNISIEGERIYHVPGQRYYSETMINPAKGERWFCSQWEAWWAGWRKAKV